MSGKATRTRALIVRKTAPIFNKQGYNGTSLLDLSEATGLTKGALYGNFKNKQGIALEVFKYSMKETKAAAARLIDGENTCQGKLTRLFQFYGDHVMDSPIPGGCPMMNNAVDADDHQTFLKQAVANEISRSIDFIANILDKGRKQGEFKNDISPRELALTFFCAIEGAIVISRVMATKAPMKAVLNHCQQILNQISK